MKKIIYVLSVILFFAACESMEDTYSEYNTPKERYVGKCSDLVVEQGWERFRLSWINGVDAAVVNIKVKWEDEAGLVDSVMLAPKVDSYETEAIFTDQSYKFTITAVDNRGVESFAEETYSRPFTAESTVVEMYKVVEKKFYFVGDELILLLYEAGKDIYTAEISYLSGGYIQTRIIRAEDYENGRLVIDGIDPDSDVSIAGKMNINECYEDIPLESYVLDRTKKNWSGGFIGNMREQLDLHNVTDEHLNNVEILYVNYNISSIEDIMYLPNLKKVVLGQRRMNSSSLYLTYESYVSKFEDVKSSVFALRKMHAEKGVEVEIYGNQFLIKDSLDFETVHNTNAPTAFVIPSDVDQWELTINDPAYYENEDESNNHPYPLEYLLGGNDWMSIQVSSEINTHEIIYNMKEMKKVAGIQFSEAAGVAGRNFLPKSIQVHLSKDGDNWETAFYQASINVGGQRGEVTIAKMREPKLAQYVKLVLADVEATPNNCVAIDDFIPLLVE